MVPSLDLSLSRKIFQQLHDLDGPLICAQYIIFSLKFTHWLGIYAMSSMCQGLNKNWEYSAEQDSSHETQTHVEEGR